MPGIGLFSWVLIVLAALSGGALVYYLTPSAGRHARKPARMNIDEPISENLSEETVVLDQVEDTVIIGQLYGSDVISGYDVGDRDQWNGDFDEDPDIGVRPYLLHYWKSKGVDLDQTAQMGWFGGISPDEDEDERPRIAPLIAA